MATIPSITTWSFEQVLTAAALNGNFATIRDALVARGLFTDEARTVTAVLTFSTSPAFPAAVTFADDVTVDGTLTANYAGSGANLTDLPSAELTGDLPAISGANLTGLTGANVTGSLDVDAVTTDALTMASGRAIVHRTTLSGGNVTVNAALGNHFRVQRTGNGTITVSNMADGQVILVEVGQDATGGRTTAWSGVTSWDDGNTPPTVTTTANRKDLYAFVRGGADTLGVVLGQNYASTS